MSKAIQIARLALYASKNIKSAGSIVWQYYKVEAAPPMTIGLLNGPFGKNLEATTGNLIDGVIKGLSDSVRNLEYKAAQAIKAKEDAIKAQIAKQKAEEKKKEDEKKAAAAAAAQKAAEEAKKVAASKAAEAKAAEAKKAEEAKKSEAAKKGGDTKKSKPKK